MITGRINNATTPSSAKLNSSPPFQVGEPSLRACLKTLLSDKQCFENLGVTLNEPHISICN